MHPPATMTRSIYGFVDDLDLEQPVSSYLQVFPCRATCRPRRATPVGGSIGSGSGLARVMARVSRIPEKRTARPREKAVGMSERQFQFH